MKTEDDLSRNGEWLPAPAGWTLCEVLDAGTGTRAGPVPAVRLARAVAFFERCVDEQGRSRAVPVIAASGGSLRARHDVLRRSEQTNPAVRLVGPDDDIEAALDELAQAACTARQIVAVDRAASA